MRAHKVKNPDLTREELRELFLNNGHLIMHMANIFPLEVRIGPPFCVLPTEKIKLTRMSRFNV